MGLDDRDPGSRDARVDGIGQHANYARMGEPSPDQFAIPSAAVCAARKTQAQFVETFDNGISRSLALKQFEDGADRALHLLIGVERNLAICIHITNR